MSDIAVHVENLSKEYHIGAHLRERNFREALVDAVKAPFRRAGKLLRGQATGAAELDETIWALNEVSFEIKSGEVVGIIGGNGAGKSTLLKVISRIAEPTDGFAEIRGRLSSLLEVGTGFHPELTGRENIYLNGAILGMKKVEIRRKFDEIVSFSGVDKFVDTPVKHYSSGMYLRLAFAVAAHLEPEILLVDEVLAVGDANFQKKCLNKMQKVGNEGRTVIFVSHNMQAITRLCGRAILLREGRVFLDGPSHHVVGAYLSEGQLATGYREWPDPSEAPGGDIVRLRAARVKTQEGVVTSFFDVTQAIVLEMEYEVIRAGEELLSYFEVFNQEGVPIFTSLDVDPLWRGKPRPVGRYISTALIPGNFLSEGMVFVEVASIATNYSKRKLQFSVMEALSFQVIDNNNHGNSARGDWTENIDGVVRPMLEWNTQYFPNG